MKPHTTGKAGIKPSNPYDPAWHDYNRQNPHVHKSVGAEAAVEGEGSGDPGPDLNNPVIQEAIRRAADEQVKGLKSKNEELLGKFKKTQEQLKNFEGLDPEKVRSLMQRFEQDEEGQLIAQGKIDEVVQKRVKAILDSNKKQFEAMQQEKDKASQEAQTFAGKYRQSVLHNEIARKVTGLADGALPRVQRDAEAWFTVDENDQLVPTEKAPIWRDGKQLSLDNLKEYLVETAPFYFPPSTGGGTQPGKAGAERIKNPWKKESFNLTEQGRIFKENPELASRLKNEAATSH